MAEAQITEAQQIQNGLGDLAASLFPQPGVYSGTQMISQIDTIESNLRYYLISNFRTILSWLYVEHGIVQTLVDQPVDDAFRTGFEIKSGELEANDVEQILIYMERHRILETIMQGIKWGRLYGGGAVMVITDQDPKRPLNLSRINENTPIEFRAVDMWELYNTQQNTQDNIEPDSFLGANTEFYNYYGFVLHHSRVFKITGKQAPSFLRPRLRGWGMSEVERLVRSINQYMKNQDVVFELLDEAKIDVYKIKGFTQSLINAVGTAQVADRIQKANIIKNFNNALTMDVEDDYQQKQIQFTGLADMLPQIRQGVAADLKMPITKLFGVSAAGFNAGEDDIENYNAMLEGEIRSKTKFIVVDAIAIVCQKLFGFVPEDLMIEFKPLRILSALEEEEVKNHQFNRINSSYQSGLATPQDAKKAINAESLLPVELDETSDALPPVGGDFAAGDTDNVDKPKDTTKEK